MPWKDIRAIIFDFGGVLAEDGFHLALGSLGEAYNRDPKAMIDLGLNAVYDSGYIVGKGSEEEFLQLLKKRSGLPERVSEFKKDILDRFVLRPQVVEKVRQLRAQGYVLAILSDHTDWLDQLDQRDHFSREFDQVFNSYYLGKTKRESQVFTEIVQRLGVRPSQTLLIDDNAGHIERAASRGLQVLLCTSEEKLLESLGAIV